MFFVGRFDLKKSMYGDVIMTSSYVHHIFLRNQAQMNNTKNRIWDDVIGDDGKLNCEFAKVLIFYQFREKTVFKLFFKVKTNFS